MQKTCWPSVDAAAKDVSWDYEELRELLVAALEKTVMALENITLNGSTSTVSLSTSSLSFGTQQVNATSPAQTVTVTNNGTVPLAFAGITASGDFAQSNNCSVALQPSSSCVITVTFKPMAAGASTGAVTLSDNGSGSPQIVLLNGTGVGQNADFTLPPFPQAPQFRPANLRLTI